MSTSKEKFLKKLEQQLPELCTTADLAAIGIFGSKGTLVLDRRNKKGVPFIQISKFRTKYLRDDVIAYARDHFQELRGKE